MDQNLNPASLRWTNTDSRLSAETFGRPATEIEMDCHLCLMQGETMRGWRVNALWDTGSSITVVSPVVAAKMRLIPIGDMNMNGLGGKQKAWKSKCYLRFPNGKFCGPIVVAVHELPSVDVLIGMDVISIGKLTIERKPDGGTRFTFDLNT